MGLSLSLRSFQHGYAQNNMDRVSAVNGQPARIPVHPQFTRAFRRIIWFNPGCASGSRAHPYPLIP
jgi:hypothetical protein